MASDETADRGLLVDYDRQLGKPIAGTSTPNNTGMFSRDGDEIFYTVQTISNAPWRIVFDAPTDELFGPLDAGRRGPWIMFVAFSIASVVIVVLLVRVVHQRHRFARAAEVDGLTGIANRRHLDRELVHLASRLHAAFAVLMIDIDHFKQVNDRYGHQHGDQVLREVVAVIARSIRPSDLLGRWGGEEFMVLLPGSDLPRRLGRCRTHPHQHQQHHLHRRPARRHHEHRCRHPPPRRSPSKRTSRRRSLPGQTRRPEPARRRPHCTANRPVSGHLTYDSTAIIPASAW